MPQSNSDKYYNKYRQLARESLGISGAAASTAISPVAAPPQQQRNIWDVMGADEYPEWYQPSIEESPQAGLINAVGVGLWSFVDTALFGVPGSLVEEEKFLEFEDPVAKWTGAVGGFAGFVGGAPLKVGAKIAQKGFGALARKQLKEAGKESVETVVRGMRQKGLDGGLTRGAVKEITGGYRSLARQAAVDPKLRGAEFGRVTREYLEEYIQRGLDDGVLNATQGNAIRDMFTKNVFTRPLQDFKGLMKVRGLAQTNPRLARVIGHSIDDAIMFGSIDTIFEGVSMIEDGDYDWTAPLWGVGTGALFGQLSWLKPRGKASVFKKDFMAGLRSTFQRKGAFDKMSRGELIQRSSLSGKLAVKNNESPIVTHTFKGKTANVNLTSESIYDEVEKVWGRDANKAMRRILEARRGKFGRDMMKWASKEELSNIGANWRRMMLGGIFFNAHTFYDTYAHGLEPDVNDVLPSFLIGAYVQRRSNPAKFDLDHTRMNKLRQNLQVLGISPEMFSAIPTFEYRQSRLENPFLDSKFDAVRKKLEELEIITDSNEIASIELAPDVVSAASMEGSNPVFDRMYPYMQGLKVWTKPLDNISAAEAKTISELLLKVDRRFESSEGSNEALEKTFLKTQKNFEDSFKHLIESIEDPENILGITVESKRDGERLLRIPEKIFIGEELKQKALDGELEWLVDENNVKLKGEEALDLLYKQTDGFNTALKTTDLLNFAEVNPVKAKKDIESESLLKQIFERVGSFERNVESQFPDKSPLAERFSLADSFVDYIELLTKNHAIRFSEEATSVFKRDYADRDTLIGKLVDAGILHSPGNISEALVIDAIADKDGRHKVKITGEDVDSETIAKDRRFLGRVLTLQSAVGGYRGFEIDPNDPVRVTHGQVESLRNYLNNLNIKIDTMQPWLQSQLVNYAFRERVKGTDLKENQLNALFQLSGAGGARFSAAAEGVAAGFRVKLIDEARIAGHPESSVINMASDYNNTMRRIIDDSNGLVTEDVDRITIVDRAYMQGLSQAVEISGESSMSAKSTLAEFMTLLSSQKKGYASFNRQLKDFMHSRPGNDFTVLQWLGEAGVFKPKEELRDYDIDLEKFNDLLKQNLEKKMATFGYTPEFAKERYEILEQKARDNFIEDSIERGQVKHIDLNTFYDKYRIDGIDSSEKDSAVKYSDFASLVYLPKDAITGLKGIDTKILNRDVVRKVLDRIHVKSGNDFIAFRELSPSEQRARTPKIREDLIGLLGSQRAQMKVNVLSFRGGDYKKTEEVVQLTRLHEYLTDVLELPYMIVDGRMHITVNSRNGNYYIDKEINIFNDGTAINSKLKNEIKQYKQEFINGIAQELSIFKPEDGIWHLQGENGEKGLRLINLAPGADPIVVASKDLSNLKEPWKEFITEYKNREGIDPQATKQLESLEQKIDKNEILTPNEYEQMMTYLVFKQMLTGSDGDRAFMNFVNGEGLGGESTEKTLSRIKLFNTKKYVRYNKSFIQDVADSYMGDLTQLTIDTLEDGITAKVLRRIARNDGYGVAVWNDAQYAKLKDEVKILVDNLKIDWDWDNVIGKSHEDVSAFDSIGFISRDMMRAFHALMGHDPLSFNPIKPVITSGGANSPLLLGKTLFVYSESLDGFFKNNKAVDIMLTKTGAKALNPIGEPGMEDASLINTGWEGLNNQRLGSQQIRKISIESLGLMPNKDSDFALAKKSQADANYMDNAESKNMYDLEFDGQLQGNLEKMSEVMQDPIILRKWMLQELGDDALVSDLQAGEGVKSISNMAVYSALSKDANPMSYSDRYVKNKLYNIYINSVINGMKSATNQYNPEDSHRYAGQAPIIQDIGSKYRLRPTLVDRDGNVKLQGEAMLPSYAKDLTLADLHDSGYEVRMLRKGEVLKPEDVYANKEYWKSARSDGETLGTIYDIVEFLKSKGEIAEDVYIGVMVRRNPRTRPNDFALMGLKGFLEKTHGNAVMVNSMDVVNVMEGDYDFDKSDFFFAHKESMWNHVERASKFFVQGIDPGDYKEPISYKLGMSATESARAKNTMMANANIYNSAIGLVQKVPRMLGFADKLGFEGKDDSAIRSFNQERPNARFTDDAKILLGGNPDQDFMLVMDYQNKDFFQRAALETQLIIDATGTLNKRITDDIYNWRQDFMFPRMEESVVPNEMKGRNQAGFVNDLRSKGNSDGNRVRIFRKIVFNEKTKSWDEIDLSNLDRSIVSQMLSEYSKLLAVTNDSVYENTGEQRKSEYTDVVSASESFFNFNKSMNKSLYWRLRNKWGSNEGKEESPWKNDDEFKKYFGVEDKTYIDYKTKEESPYSISTKQILHPNVKLNAQEFSQGKRGAPVDRILWNFYNADPFRAIKTRTVGGRTGELIDQWYNELLGGGEASSIADVEGSITRLESKADELTRGVKKGLQDYNRKSQLVANLKKKIDSIKNSKMRWDAKNKSIVKLDDLIKKLEFEMGSDFLPFEYKKSRKAKDLDKIEMVFADDKNVIDGTIYYATLENVKDILPGGFALGEPAQKDLNFIRKIRKVFYGNRTSLKEFMRFGGKTLLTDQEISIINKFPDLNTFYELETKLLMEGFENYGPTFIYSFMQPAQNKKAVGVFNNRPVSVPYQATDTFDPSSKYRRGIRLLTGLSSGTEKTVENSGENQQLAKHQLSQIQFIESTFSRFFNKRVDQRWLVGEEVGDFLDVGALGKSGKMVLYNHLRLPDFNQDFQRLFSDFRSVQWQRDSNRMSSGFGVMNDHLIDFYRNVMRLAGKESEFDSYLEKMSIMDAEMIGNDIIDPMKYLSLRQNIDSEVRKIAGDIFIGGALKRELKNGNPVAEDIKNSPVYTLMGGSKYYEKGVSLERAPQYNIERLRELKDMHESLREIKNDLNPNMSEYKERKEEILRCLKQ